MTASLETTFSEHNPQRFLHPFSGQTAHLHRVSLTGLVCTFPLGPLTSQTDDLMQIEVASLGSRVVKQIQNPQRLNIHYAQGNNCQHLDTSFFIVVVSEETLRCLNKA